MAIDFQGLFRVLKAGERANEKNLLFMDHWVSTNRNICGTAGCLIGSFCLDNKEDDLILQWNFNFYPNHLIPIHKHLDIKDFNYYKQSIRSIILRFGITAREAEFLFTSGHLKENQAAYAMDLTSPQALARLRKFLYYKLHKQEMEYEEARRVDGNKAAIHAANAASTELPAMYDKMIGVS